ncbi:MAG: TonB C-terminal domain-containing protein [Vicinamibacteria bacterium]|nr:TonB C-terminal domain-containing protein [Vicinamibacteria bacterium]
MAVFNFNEVDEVTETTEDPRRPIPRIESPRHDPFVVGSLAVHAVALALLFLIQPHKTLPQTEEEKPKVRRAFFLPPQLAKPPAPRVVAKAEPQPTPPPPPKPVPTPPPPPKSARMSIGEASDKRAEEIRLERDRDIGRRGTKTAQDRSVPQEAMPESEKRTGEGRGEDAQNTGLPLPASGANALSRADDSRLTGPSGGILSASTRSVERALRERRDMSQMEIPGYQMGPLFFDPEGADFTRWINHFKSEVYRNWIIPEPARLGVRGQVGIEFTVDRSGKITKITMLSSSGMPALDRAASNALQGSDLLALPDDYPAPSVTMRVTFVY